MEVDRHPRWINDLTLKVTSFQERIKHKQSVVNFILPNSINQMMKLPPQNLSI